MPSVTIVMGGFFYVAIAFPTHFLYICKPKYGNSVVWQCDIMCRIIKHLIARIDL